MRPSRLHTEPPGLIGLDMLLPGIDGLAAVIRVSGIALHRHIAADKATSGTLGTPMSLRTAYRK